MSNVMVRPLWSDPCANRPVGAPLTAPAPSASLASRPPLQPLHPPPRASTSRRALTTRTSGRPAPRARSCGCWTPRPRTAWASGRRRRDCSRARCARTTPACACACGGAPSPTLSAWRRASTRTARRWTACWAWASASWRSVRGCGCGWRAGEGGPRLSRQPTELWSARSSSSWARAQDVLGEPTRRACDCAPAVLQARTHLSLRP